MSRKNWFESNYDAIARISLFKVSLNAELSVIWLLLTNLCMIQLWFFRSRQLRRLAKAKMRESEARASRWSKIERNCGLGSSMRTNIQKLIDGLVIFIVASYFIKHFFASPELVVIFIFIQCFSTFTSSQRVGMIQLREIIPPAAWGPIYLEVDR